MFAKTLTGNLARDLAKVLAGKTARELAKRLAKNHTGKAVTNGGDYPHRRLPPRHQRQG